MRPPGWPRALPRDAVVVVTGASSGIGEAVALHLARDGRRLVLAARTAADLDRVADRCREAGVAGVLTVPTDVSDDDAVAALFAAAEAAFGPVDAVAHCAGEVGYGRFEEVPADVFDRVLATNLSGSANVARHALRGMRERRRGVVVLVGSLLGHISVPQMTPYVVSKWGMVALARQLRIEGRDRPHVHVCHVSPGSVDTPIYGKALSSDGKQHTPPPPTISPERAAATVVRRLEHPVTPFGTTQTAWSNFALIAAFRAAPWAYDRVVGPLFTAVDALRGDGPDDAGSGDDGTGNTDETGVEPSGDDTRPDHPHEQDAAEPVGS